MEHILQKRVIPFGINTELIGRRSQDLQEIHGLYKSVKL